MEDEQIQLMWILFVVLLAQSANCLCPTQCVCDDTSLKVSCNAANLEVIPIQLNPAVQIIDLAENKITDIHFTLSIYTNLMELDLSKNYIESLGSSNFELQCNLKVLNLGYNIIHSLMKDSFKGLKSLVILDLSFNNLKELPVAAFKELQNLIVLKVNSNRLEYLEAGLLKYTRQLQKLYLNDNQLLQIPGNAISEGIKLRYLSLSQNLMEYIEEEAMPFLPELRVLLLNTNVINYMNPSALSNLESLEVLDLSDNNFTVIPTDSLSKLSNLTKLYLSGNFVQSIPAVAFRGLFRLQYLYLNRLEVLSHIDVRAFVDNICLEKIWLDNNIAFQVLPINIFHGNPKIKEISLTNNQIPTLDVSHFPLDKLSSLKLGGNPLQCNCSLFWLWKLLQEQKTQEIINNTQESDLILDMSNISCAGPEYVLGKLLIQVKESQVVCSLGWVAIVSVSATVVMLFSIIIILLYFGFIKRRLTTNEMQPKAGPSSSHYGNMSVNIPYQENTQKRMYTHYPSEYLLPKVNDTWTLPPNLMQISR
ncbi:chondroadherin-like [Agrilus planipennis]|uniref:Chondroadherin-like n=1 Tax=Agrilus planipennis TaxID=224129 RepID=A0A1W4WYI4_AGRPL|nr:chondroadherin-like [Agrilus planipennis]